MTILKTMRFPLQAFALIFFANIISAQPSNPKKLLDAGVAYFERDQIDSAAICWEKILTVFKENDPEYGRAMLNLGVVAEVKADKPTAKKWYKTALLSDLNELDPPFEENEEYACYKHTACMRLSTLAAKAGEYQEALKYVLMAEKTFPYKTTNGSSFEYRAVTLAKWQASFYNRLSMPDSALHVLLQKELDREIAYRLPSMATFSADDYYADVTRQAQDLVLKKYGSKEKFLKKLNKGMDGLAIRTEGLITFANLEIDGFKIQLGTVRPKAGKDDFIAQIKSTELYVWAAEK